MQHKFERIGKAESFRIPLIAATIAVRFQELAPSRWLIADPALRAQAMPKNIAMWAQHALVHGEIHVITSTTTAEGRARPTRVPQAAAIWMHADRSGAEPAPSPAMYHRRLTADCGRHARRFEKLDDLFDRHHPQDRGPHHHLAFLAAAQEGQALGTALLRHHLELLDRRAFGAYLVAADERSRALYERHGFEPLDQVLELPGADHVMYPMWRWPKAPATPPS